MSLSNRATTFHVRNVARAISLWTPPESVGGDGRTIQLKCVVKAIFEEEPDL
jgi:hypothetical protein